MQRGRKWAIRYDYVRPKDIPAPLKDFLHRGLGRLVGLGVLTERQAQTVSLTKIYGLSQAEAAQEMCITLDQVKKAAGKARVAMAEDSLLLWAVVLADAEPVITQDPRTLVFEERKPEHPEWWEGTPVMTAFRAALEDLKQSVRAAETVAASDPNLTKPEYGISPLIHEWEAKLRGYIVRHWLGLSLIEVEPRLNEAEDGPRYSKETVTLTGRQFYVNSVETDYF